MTLRKLWNYGSTLCPIKFINILSNINIFFVGYYWEGFDLKRLKAKFWRPHAENTQRSERKKCVCDIENWKKINPKLLKPLIIAKCIFSGGP